MEGGESREGEDFVVWVDGWNSLPGLFSSMVVFYCFLSSSHVFKSCVVEYWHSNRSIECFYSSHDSFATSVRIACHASAIGGGMLGSRTR